MIKITDSQGTKVYLVPAGTDVSTAVLIGTAKASGKQIGCLQDIGDISVSRSVQSYGCLSSDEVAKSLGSLTLPSISMNLLFDALDATGQAELRAMWTSRGRRIMIIELPDNAGTAPTYITFEAAVSTFGNNISKDNAVMQNVTVEICSNPVTLLATV